MKEKIISISFVGILFSFLILSFFMKDKEISSYERRKLMTSSKLKEDFVEHLDTYLTDQFPFRDNFISLHTVFERYGLFNIDSNDVYIKNGYVVEKNYPLDEKSVSSFISKLNYIKETYLQDNKVFYTIIPDKAYFLNQKKYLTLNYNDIFQKLLNNIKIDYIDIIDLLNLEDYYKTDIHIKQPSYQKIVNRFSDYLTFTYDKSSYDEHVYNKFYGASYSKVPSFTKPDELVYLTNKSINEATVWHLEYGEKKVYDEEKLGGVDSYDVFLSGPSALIEIENKADNVEGELIIFRDSFGSSFAPLLIPYYKKITLIDLRYIDFSLLDKYVSFQNQDVLFAYSTLIVNNSQLLKVRPN